MPNQVVLAWLTGGDPAVVPIVGVSSLDQLEEVLAAADLELPTSLRKRLDEAADRTLPPLIRPWPAGTAPTPTPAGDRTVSWVVTSTVGALPVRVLDIAFRPNGVPPMNARSALTAALATGAVAVAAAAVGIGLMSPYRAGRPVLSSTSTRTPAPPAGSPPTPTTP